jgi:hypothetical protein
MLVVNNGFIQVFGGVLDSSLTFSCLYQTRRQCSRDIILLLCFPGCTLLFYETYGKNSMDQSSAPRCALFVEDSIVQSVPEHPKKEHVFCLSNSFGDVYLFQVLLMLFEWRVEAISCL